MNRNSHDKDVCPQENYPELSIFGEDHNNSSDQLRKKQFEMQAIEGNIILLKEGAIFSENSKEKANIYGIESNKFLLKYAVTLHCYKSVVLNCREFRKSFADTLERIPGGLSHLMGWLDDLVKDNELPDTKRLYFRRCRGAFTGVVCRYVENLFNFFTDNATKNLTHGLLKEANLFPSIDEYFKKYGQFFNKGYHTTKIENFDNDFFETFFKYKDSWNKFLEERLLPELLREIPLSNCSYEQSTKELQNYFLDPCKPENEKHFMYLTVDVRNIGFCRNILAIVEENAARKLPFVCVVGGLHVDGIKNILENDYATQISNFDISYYESMSLDCSKDVSSQPAPSTKSVSSPVYGSAQFFNKGNANGGDDDKNDENNNTKSKNNTPNNNNG